MSITVKAFSPFGKWGIVFPLKNKESQIVSLYFRSTLSPTGGNGKGGSSRHYYLKDRQGLYPQYPKSSTKRLILTESIIDSASLEAQTGIQDKYSVLALFGTNGFTEEHTEAISQLKELEEIIFFFDGDQAGRSAIAKYAPMLKAEYPKLSISHVATPENEDVNSLLQGHSPAILDHLVSTRKEYDVLFSVAESPEELLFSNEKESPSEDVERLDTQLKVEAVRTGLDTNNPYNLKYQGLAANYQIKGFKINQLDSLKITLQVQAK
jgi:DNA primase